MFGDKRDKVAVYDTLTGYQYRTLGDAGIALAAELDVASNRYSWYTHKDKYPGRFIRQDEDGYPWHLHEEDEVGPLDA
jgi:hypothetical protein